TPLRNCFARNTSSLLVPWSSPASTIQRVRQRNDWQPIAFCDSILRRKGGKIDHFSSGSDASQHKETLDGKSDSSFFPASLALKVATAQTSEVVVARTPLACCGRAPLFGEIGFRDGRANPAQPPRLHDHE